MSRRLAQLIERHPVVCVYATPGAGKTTAVLQATALMNRSLCWLTVDSTDGAPGRLVTYLQAALARQVPAIEEVASTALAAGIPHAETAGLLAEATRGTPLMLVLDGLERLADARDALAVLEAFARYAPPELRLVLVSREELELDIGRTPWPGTAAVVGEADLALTAAEAADCWNASGTPGSTPAGRSRSPAAGSPACCARRGAPRHM